MGNPNPIAKLAEHIGDAPVPPLVGVGAIALQMAMQYHDMAIVKDGQLYQHYKNEGRNIQEIGLIDVFETAKKIEEHLMGTSDRIAGIVVDAIEQGVAAEKEAKDIFDACITNIQEGDEETLAELHGYFLEARGEHGEDLALIQALIRHLVELGVDEDTARLFVCEDKSLPDDIVKAISNYKVPE